MIVRTSRNLFKVAVAGIGQSRRGIKQLLDIHPEVLQSLQRAQPVVALESTIITHGMPYPENLETATEVENVVRAHGAVPATIAIIDGRIKVGLTTGDLEGLACKEQKDVIKCSRRDLPFLLANGRSGGTTVAATMIIAHMSGIKIFATGGVGGVHREGHITMDVSADLVELGRTPVAVVSSGIKSILDIPRTLEYLETQGVCVATYGSAGGAFPDFYTRDSGCKVAYNLESAADGARLIRALNDLKFESGILIGVPIPEEYAADKKVIDAAIEKALLEAQQKRISGKDVTPFLLAAIAKMTKGNSLKSNIALIKNNATVAAQIARELCKDEGNADVRHAKGNNKKQPLIIGASIFDVSFRLVDDMVAEFNCATYKTKVKQSAGGVARNMAEAIHKMYGGANLVSMLGNDHIGTTLMELIPQPLRRNVLIDAKSSTCLCAVVFDKMGDCKIMLGDMEIHEKITPEVIRQHEELFVSAPVIIIDSNLSIPTMECILTLAKKHKRPVFFEPTDMLIAHKPFTLSPSLTKQIRILSPNLNELKTIVEAITKKPITRVLSGTASAKEVLERAQWLVQQVQEHFDCVLVTLGPHGILASCRKTLDYNKPLFDESTGKYLLEYDVASGGDNCEYILYHYVPQDRPKIVNVSGAGDSFSSGFVTGMLRGYEVERCVALGFVAASCALQTEAAVPAQYFANANDEATKFNDTLKKLTKLELTMKKN